MEMGIKCAFLWAALYEAQPITHTFQIAYLLHKYNNFIKQYSHSAARSFSPQQKRQEDETPQKINDNGPSIRERQVQLKIDVRKSDQSNNADVVNFFRMLDFRQFSDTQASPHGRNVPLQQ